MNVDFFIKFPLFWFKDKKYTKELAAIINSVGTYCKTTNTFKNT